MIRTLSLVAAAAASLLCVASASAADAPRRQVAQPYYPAPVTDAWQGFYAGFNVSYGWSNSSSSFDTGVGVIDSSVKATGIGGGGTLGYNWQVSRFVFGLEGDANWGNIKGSGQNDFALFGGLIPGTIAGSTSLDSYATVRGRLGYAFGDRQQWLPYVTGGWAMGRMTASGDASVFGAPIGSFSTSQTKHGYALGGGVEYKINQALSAKVEYLHLDLGSLDGTANTIAGPFAVSAPAKANLIRAGLNFHF